jgi:hypothetical protein
MRPLSIALVALAFALLGAGCGDEEEAPATSTQGAIETATGTSTPTSTAVATGTPEPAQALDFTDPLVIGPVIDHFGGGEVLPERVEYVDITGDGIDEAIAFVESGGTQGDLGAAVLQAVEGQPVVLGYVDAGGRVETRLTEAGGGVIASLEGVYEPGDPECCPSKLHERVFRWDGSEFVMVVDQIIASEQDDGY